MLALRHVSIDKGGRWGKEGGVRPRRGGGGMIARKYDAKLKVHAGPAKDVLSIP